MPNITLVLLIIVALMLWGSVFTVLHRRNVPNETDGPHLQVNGGLLGRFRILERAFAGVTAENGFDAASDEVRVSAESNRAETYLRRIVTLTGARRLGNRYTLNGDKTIFHVRDRFVWRLPDSTNPECGYNETCFYSVNKGTPREEEIATVLLQLKNNPALFDEWVRQKGLAFKADGQVFTGAQ